jgi:polar amino acid transport system ATP-binding protein/sulfate transport system ATP-binding protein
MQLVTAHIMGVVAQNYPLFRHLTVMTNMLRVSKDKARIEELMKKFGVWEVRNSYPKFISGGQRQRCAIIQQILCSGRYFLMDEPFSGLDIIKKCEACALIRELASQDEETTIYIITHSMEDALKVADRVLMLGYVGGEEGYGSTIIHDINLIERGLDMNCCPKKSPLYMSLVTELEDKFKTL